MNEYVNNIMNNKENIINMICQCTHNLKACIDNDNILICDFCGIRYCKRCTYNSNEISISTSHSYYWCYCDYDDYKCEICDDSWL